MGNVPITVAKTPGVEGRGGFSEAAGAMRDIGQHYVPQVLELSFMEPPTFFHSEAIRDEKGRWAICALADGQAIEGNAGIPGGARVDQLRNTGFSSKCLWASRTGGGTPFRSTCAPASGWAPRMTEVAMAVLRRPALPLLPGREGILEPDALIRLGEVV